VRREGVDRDEREPQRPEAPALLAGHQQEAAKLAHRVRPPALILQGAQDRTVSPASAHKLAKLLASPKVEVRILPESGHVLPLDRESEAVCSAIVQFFQGAT
jgi:esterase/lipase